MALEEIAVKAESLLDELQPSIVINVGLWPGEAMVRIERVALNLVDFEIPDNRGLVAHDESLSANGPTAKFATLPIRKIEEAIRSATRIRPLAMPAARFSPRPCRRPAASTRASSPNTCMATSSIRSSAKLPLATMASGAKRASSGPNSRVSPTIISSNSVTSNKRSSFGGRITGLHRSSTRSPMLLSNCIQRQLGALLQSRL